MVDPKKTEQNLGVGLYLDTLFALYVAGGGAAPVYKEGTVKEDVAQKEDVVKDGIGPMVNLKLLWDAGKVAVGPFAQYLLPVYEQVKKGKIFTGASIMIGDGKDKPVSLRFDLGASYSLTDGSWGCVSNMSFAWKPLLDNHLGVVGGLGFDLIHGTGGAFLGATADIGL